MSGDNYWMVVPNPDGGFSPVMGFASNDEHLDPEDVPVPRVGAPVFATPEAALASVIDDWAEYGHSISPLCTSGAPMDLREAVESARARLSYARGDLEALRDVAFAVESRLRALADADATVGAQDLVEFADLLGQAAAHHTSMGFHE